MNISRRWLVKTAAAVLAGGAAVGAASSFVLRSGNQQETVNVGQDGEATTFRNRLSSARDDLALLRPPGSQGERDFLSRCVKCGKCLQACPYRALDVARASVGLSVGSPHIDAREQACRLCEDFPCVKACPTGALRDVRDRTDVHMGIAVIDEDLCIAFQGMRCEVCYRACPLIDEAIAIDYRLRDGDAIHAVFAPVVSEDSCVGCGLCVERCVVDEPKVAIRIRPDS